MGHSAYVRYGVISRQTVDLVRRAGRYPLQVMEDVAPASASSANRAAEGDLRRALRRRIAVRRVVFPDRNSRKGHDTTRPCGTTARGLMRTVRA
jgi:hypothetical protein